jgi:hypothetical protein
MQVPEVSGIAFARKSHWRPFLDGSFITARNSSHGCTIYILPSGPSCITPKSHPLFGLEVFIVTDEVSKAFRLLILDISN